MTKKVKIDIVAKDKTKRAIGSAKKSLGGLKTFALAASAALATIGAGKVITNLVNVGKEVESLKVRFKFLFGSAEEGKIAFDNLATFAGKVPFSLEEIARSSGNLAVVSKDAKDLSRILEITGNVAAVTGLDFNTTASQIQRAFSGGIAAADVFREKGVRSLLGFKEGAKVSIDDTVKAFEDVFSGDGKFGNATDELAKTFEGTMSMIGDSVFQFKNAINEEFFNELKSQFGDLNTALGENKETWLGWGRDIGSGLATFVQEFVDQFDLIFSVFGLLGRAFDKAYESSFVFRKIIDSLAAPFRLLGDAIGYVFDNNEKWADQLDSLIPKAEIYQDHILRIAENTKNLTDATSDLTDVNQDAKNIIEETNFVLDERAQIMKSNILETERARIAQDALNQSLNQQFGFEDKKAKAQQKGIKESQKKNKAEKDGLRQTGQALKAFAAEGAQRSKKMFKLQQAINIGQAIMSTYTGAANALRDLPAPFNFAVAALTVATGLAQVANIRAQQPPAMFGGSRQQGTPFLVGERGPELFTPSNAGTVTPNHQLGGGGATVNFNITTVDASSFGALLDTRRGQIVNMINTALNNKGQAALV